jgi:hypothetical protein
VGTAVVENVNPAIVTADHDQRLAPDLNTVEIAGVLDLGLVTAIDPHLLEDAFHLEVEYRGVGVHAAMNAIGLDEISERGHGGTPQIG